jgi:hypothetical protein
MSFELKDNGEHRQFDSGAKRDRPKGKGRFDLLFMHVQDRLACILEKGAEKYAAWNWSQGMPLSVYMDSAMRHLNQFRQGYTDEDHLGQAIWNLCALCETQEWIARGILPKELDDLPSFMPKGEFENIGEGRLRLKEEGPKDWEGYIECMPLPHKITEKDWPTYLKAAFKLGYSVMSQNSYPDLNVVTDLYHVKGHRYID